MIQRIIELAVQALETEEPDDEARARQKYLDAWRQFRAHVGGMELLLDRYLAEGLDVGYPFSLYLGMAGRDIETLPVASIAANLVSFALVSTDGFDQPRSVIAAHIEQTIGDLDLLTRVDVAIGDLLLKCQIRETTGIRKAYQEGAADGQANVPAEGDAGR